VWITAYRCPRAKRATPPSWNRGPLRVEGDSVDGQWMVASTVVFVFTGLFLLLRVVTVSVTWTVTELGPAQAFCSVSPTAPRPRTASAPSEARSSVFRRSLRSFGSVARQAIGTVIAVYGAHRPAC
jgi:hypothetical protein